MNLLEVHDLHAAYGVVIAIRGVSVSVERGQVVALLGANGAGKSTTLNTVSGLLPSFRGRVIFDGRNITGWRADRIAALGLIQVRAGSQVAPALTVQQNLLMGAYRRSDSAALYADLDDFLQRFPRLDERRHHKAGSLSSSEQRTVAVGRALIAKPRLLMLDEPGAGLESPSADEIFRMIADLKVQGVPILLADQDSRRALPIADHVYVLHRGAVAHQGPADVLRREPGIISAYLA
jgi:branched-chain amino acid transport system ATP-binding protein